MSLTRECVCVYPLLLVVIIVVYVRAQKKFTPTEKKSFLTTIITESQIECKRVYERAREAKITQPDYAQKANSRQSANENQVTFFFEICEQVAHAGMFSLV